MELLKLCHVRLDREQIIEIDNLDCLGPVTNLYLQNVRTYCILWAPKINKNLVFFVNLKILCMILKW